MNKKNNPALNQQEIRKSNIVIHVTQDDEEDKDQYSEEDFEDNEESNDHASKPSNQQNNY